MQVFVGANYTMIAAPVQCDVDRIPRGAIAQEYRRWGRPARLARCGGRILAGAGAGSLVRESGVETAGVMPFDDAPVGGSNPALQRRVKRVERSGHSVEFYRIVGGIE
jgi:hypothetical protein